jgi:hypothetical protein
VEPRESRDGAAGVDGVAARKTALRDRLVTTRHRRSLVEVSQAARDIADHLLETVEVRHAATLAAYVSIDTEPGTGPLIERLRAMGRRVILPVVLPDLDLDWAVYDGPEHLERARRGLLEPTGQRLGTDAIATADVVLTPGLTAPGCDWAPGAAATTGPSAASRSGRSPAPCSTTVRCSTRCRRPRTTDR